MALQAEIGGREYIEEAHGVGGVGGDQTMLSHYYAFNTVLNWKREGDRRILETPRSPLMVDSPTYQITSSIWFSYGNSTAKTSAPLGFLGLSFLLRLYGSP